VQSYYGWHVHGGWDSRWDSCKSSGWCYRLVQEPVTEAPTGHRLRTGQSLGERSQQARTTGGLNWMSLVWRLLLPLLPVGWSSCGC